MGRNYKEMMLSTPGLVLLCWALFMTALGLLFYLVTTAQAQAQWGNRQEMIKLIESSLAEWMSSEKGRGCEVPRLTASERGGGQRTVRCAGRDWARCHLSECRALPWAVAAHRKLLCEYWDVPPAPRTSRPTARPAACPAHHVRRGAAPLALNESDHVQVVCIGQRADNMAWSRWTGHGVGFRPLPATPAPAPAPAPAPTAAPTPAPPPPPPDVLIFIFDSASRTGFTSLMPKTYKYLTEVMNASIVYGFNVVGDGTAAALFPLLSGRTELELPDARRGAPGAGRLPAGEFLFHKVKPYGYRTAYLEDRPEIGTFQYRFKGFDSQPADHYLRALLQDYRAFHNTPYCFGDTPMFKVLMNLTDQFFQLPGPRVCLTFVSDISHDDFELISSADEDMERLLRGLEARGALDSALLYVMGDHGRRFEKSVRISGTRAKLEERLPFLGVRLGAALAARRPRALAALRANAGAALVTAHDLHATALDALGLLPLANNLTLPGADLRRGLSLLAPIPPSRSCSEAGVLPHWCACVQWRPLAPTDPLYLKLAQQFVEFVNRLTHPLRPLCRARALRSVWAAARVAPRRAVLSFVRADADGLLARFDHRPDHPQLYQVKLELSPGASVFEATASYSSWERVFRFNTREISRLDQYGSQPHCVEKTHPHLNMFCYCTDLPIN